MRAGDGRSGRCSACSARVVRLSFVRRGLNKHVGHAYARASRLFFSRDAKPRVSPFSARDLSRIGSRAAAARLERWKRSFTRASRSGLADALDATATMSDLDWGASRASTPASLESPPGATPRARDAERRATPVAAANFAFLARLKSRVPRRAGRRGSLLASPRVPLTTVPPLRAAPHFALPKPQTTRSSRSPTSPPRPRRRRRSRPIPASRTKTRRSRR